MPNETQPPTPLATVLGGIHLQARFRDGKTETVLVRELPVRELPSYARALDDEAKSVELLLGKPEGWADWLTNESFLEILTKADELNVPFLAAFLKRKIERARRATPDFDLHIRHLTEAILIANGTLSPSPISASPSA